MVLKVEMAVKVGVPQGSVFGILLFLIHFNDVFQLLLPSRPYGLADATSLFHSSTSASENNRYFSLDLSVISEYFDINRLTRVQGHSLSKT